MFFDRSIIKDCVNASEHDAAIFVGTGCTGAVNKLIQAMRICEAADTPVVFAGPYDHHSTLLPWREVGAQVDMPMMMSTKEQHVVNSRPMQWSLGLCSKI